MEPAGSRVRAPMSARRALSLFAAGMAAVVAVLAYLDTLPAFDPPWLTRWETVGDGPARIEESSACFHTLTWPAATPSGRARFVYLPGPHDRAIPPEQEETVLDVRLPRDAVLAGRREGHELWLSAAEAVPGARQAYRYAYVGTRDEEFDRWPPFVGGVGCM